jgi:hypothetical protein
VRNDDGDKGDDRDDDDDIDGGASNPVKTLAMRVGSFFEAGADPSAGFRVQGSGFRVKRPRLRI